jgi:probable phosphoglycerate mutase
MTTRLVLVRHGESRATVNRLMGGPRSCKGLTELGARQAEALRDRWKRTGEVSADVVYASVLPRAVETAEIVVPALGNLDIEQDCDLCELHVGDADELTWDEYEERYGGFPWTTEADRVIAPGGESWTSFQTRVAGAVDRLVADHNDQTVAVFCHGGFIRNATRALMADHEFPPRWTVFFENTSITEWVLEGDGRWRIVRLNDFAHLADVS